LESLFDVLICAFRSKDVDIVETPQVNGVGPIPDIYDIQHQGIAKLGCELLDAVGQSPLNLRDGGDA
jgi:hypothetical protein